MCNQIEDAIRATVYAEALTARRLTTGADTEQQEDQ